MPNADAMRAAAMRTVDAHMHSIRTNTPLVDRVHVLLGLRNVGTLARTNEGLFAFEYHDEWLENGFSISPLSLPLERKVFIPQRIPLDGMFGVFQDSIPDGWGRLLVDRSLRARGFDLFAIDDLTRLSIVGASGMGALEYEPAYFPELPSTSDFSKETLDGLAAECSVLLSRNSSVDLDTLFVLGGSSGGARPKILVTIDGEDWIIKFPTTADPQEIGEQEYDYALVAKDCGIEMPEVCLLPSKLYSGYFGVKRFDRESDEMLSREPFEEPAKGATGGPLGKPPVGSPLKSQHRKIHMVSVAGLLETSHRIPNLDYSQLMKLTLHLTQDMTELKRLFRQMCFNVYARNRDDHSKNFSFLYHETQAVWRLSPAYDLTCSSSHYGEHATTIAGNGRDPGLDDILAVAKQAGLSQRWAKTTALEIKEKTTVLERFWRV